jgi:hypothetical protein
MALFSHFPFLSHFPSSPLSNVVTELNHTSQEIQKKKDQITPKKPKKKTEAETPLGLMTKDLLSTLLEAEEQEERAREKKRGDSVKVRAKHLTEEERQNLLYVFSRFSLTAFL